MKKIVIWLFIIGLAAAAGVYLYLFYFGAKHKDPLKSDEIHTVSAIDLFDLFSNNEDSANALYLGKVIKVTGVVSSIDKNGNKYTVNYKTNGDMGTVMCEMDETENAEIANLKEGNEIQIAGFCNGINLDVYLDRCKLAK